MNSGARVDRFVVEKDLLGAHLAALVQEPNRRRLARVRLRDAFERGVVEAICWCTRSAKQFAE
jgi:transposase